MELDRRGKLILEEISHHPEGVSPDEINARLVAEGEDKVDRKRLFRYVDSFKKNLGININKERYDGVKFRYSLSDKEYMPTGLSEQLATSYLDDNLVKTFRKLGPRFVAPSILSGGGFLRTIGEAMNKNLLLHVVYQKFNDQEPYDCILAPHVLKAFEGRWYIFALKWMNEDEIKTHPLGTKGVGLQTFALDRIKDVRVTKKPFRLMEGFDAATSLQYQFGTYCYMDAKPSKIRIFASEKDAQYIRTLPVHHSQKEVKPNIFEVTIVRATDFDIYMRRFPDTTWEVVEEKRGRKKKVEV